MADSAKLQKFSIAIESGYGLGGASYSDLPIFVESKPRLISRLDELPVVSASLGKPKSYYTPQFYEMDISFHLKGSGIAGTVPELGKLFRIMGMEETDGASTVTYKVRDSAFESGDIKVNLNGWQYRFLGARMTDLAIPLKGNEKCICTAKIKGLVSNSGIPTSVAWSAPTFADSAVVPATVGAMALTINGNTHVMPEFNLKMGTPLEDLESVNAANNGIEEIMIDQFRDYTGSFIAIRDSNNDTEFFTLHTNNTEFAVASTGFGSAGNLIDVDFANCQLTKVDPIDYKGRAAFQCDFQINQHATAASEFQLKFA